MGKETPKRLFTVQEAADYLGLPVKRIYEALRRGARPEAKKRFPVPAKKAGKLWHFERKDLDAYADSIPYARR
jgi:excisionase family DNA binding protein